MHTLMAPVLLQMACFDALDGQCLVSATKQNSGAKSSGRGIGPLGRTKLDSAT